MTSCSYFNKQLSVDCRRAMCRYCNCKARNRNWPQLTTIKIALKPPTKSEMFKCDQILLRLISFLILAVKVDIYISFLSDLARKLIQSEMYIFPRIKCNSRGTKPNLKLKPTIHRRLKYWICSSQSEAGVDSK